MRIQFIQTTDRRALRDANIDKPSGILVKVVGGEADGNPRMTGLRRRGRVHSVGK